MATNHGNLEPFAKGLRICPFVTEPLDNQRRRFVIGTKTFGIRGILFNEPKQRGRFKFETPRIQTELLRTNISKDVFARQNNLFDASELATNSHEFHVSQS